MNVPVNQKFLSCWTNHTSSSHHSLTCHREIKTAAKPKANGENNQAFTKKYILYSFGLKMILPYERTVVTSCMQFTKTPQAQREMATDCFMVCIYRNGTIDVLKQILKKYGNQIPKMHLYLQ